MTTRIAVFTAALIFFVLSLLSYLDGNDNAFFLEGASVLMAFIALFPGGSYGKHGGLSGR